MGSGNGKSAKISSSGTEARRARCPICSAPAEPQFRPFCSQRCADVDLSRWLRGAYAIPGAAEADEDGDDSHARTAARDPAAAAGDTDDAND